MPAKPRAAKSVPRKSPATARKSEASPVKSVAEELELLRKSFREIVKNYAHKIETEIAEIRDIVLGLTDSAESLPVNRVHELRDMLTLMRTLQIKQEKGRRKDVKKIESLIGDLRQFVDGWQ